MNDLIPFSIGMASGIVVTFVAWLRLAFRQYVVNCGNGNCPHHGTDIKKRINARNDKARRDPPRPDIR